LAAEDFPPLLLREGWPQPVHRELVRDYLDWCAPFLLMLPGLADRARDQLDHAARVRALYFDALRRLYPKILNPRLLKSIRVEARMRRARSSPSVHHRAVLSAILLFVWGFWGALLCPSMV